MLPGELIVSKSSRVVTKYGCPRVSELPARGAKIWSGREWVKVWVCPEEKVGEFYSVRLDDGTRLDCAGNVLWPVVTDGDITAVATRDLRPGAPVCLSPPPAGRLGGYPLAAAFELGRAAGSRKGQQTELPDGLFVTDPASLQAFVAGWADAQGGNIVGDEEVLRELQMLLRRAAPNRSRVVDHGTYASLSLDTKRRTGPFPRVEEVVLVKGRVRGACRLVVDGDISAVVDGALLLLAVGPEAGAPSPRAPFRRQRELARAAS